MAGRAILLTGGSGRIGEILLSHFLALDDTVFITTRNASSLERLRDKHSDRVSQLKGVAVDFTDPDVVEIVTANLRQADFSPSYLINNARALDFLGIMPDGHVPRVNFLNEYLVDVVVPYELTMALVRLDVGGLRRVINIGSQYGVVAANKTLYTDFDRQSPIHYSVAKAALGHLTKELAVRLASHGVQVNCVAYGGLEGRVDEAFKQRYAQLCPQGRMLSDEDVAGPIDMLLAEGSAGITGHTLVVDGGWSIW